MADVRRSARRAAGRRSTSSAGPAARDVVLSQERYLRDRRRRRSRRRQAALADSGLSAHSSSGETSCEVLREKRQEVSLDGCPAWVMGNAGAPRLLPHRGAARDGADAGGEDRHAVARRAHGRAVGRMGAGARRPARRRQRSSISASGFRDERTASVMSTLTGLLATIGDEFTTDATRDSYRAVAGRSSSRRRWPTSGWPGGPPTDDETQVAARHAWSASPARPRAIRRCWRRRATLVLQELDKAGSVEPTLLAVADRPRRARGRRRALRPLSRDEQGGDRPGRALSVSLRADRLRRSRRWCAGPWSLTLSDRRSARRTRRSCIGRMLGNADTRRACVAAGARAVGRDPEENRRVRRQHGHRRRAGVVLRRWRTRRRSRRSSRPTRCPTPSARCSSRSKPSRSRAHGSCRHRRRSWRVVDRAPEGSGSTRNTRACSASRPKRLPYQNQFNVDS